jgi:hypothetical protein
VRPRTHPTLSLLPREHGSYGQLAFPALSALVLTGANRPGTAVTLAAIGAFLMHEPLLVTLGLRGTRARREQGARATAMLGVLAGVVALLLAFALITSPAPLARPLAISAALAAGVLVFVLRRQERSAPGEVLAAAALASVAVPAMCAGGAPIGAAVWLWLVWSVTSAVVILAIRTLVARRHVVVSRIGTSVVAAAVLAGFALLPGTHTRMPSGWTVAPSCAFALLLCAAAPSPRRMRAVGWSAVVVSVLTTAAIVSTGWPGT